MRTDLALRLEVQKDVPCVRFFVPGIPAPKPVGPPKRTSPGYLRYQAFRQVCQLRARPFFREPLRGAVALSCSFYLPTPSAWSCRQVEEALADKIAPVKKPDLKNLIAGLEDALNGVAWLDDSQVTDYAQIGKWYVTDDKLGTYVRVYLADRGDEGRLSEMAVTQNGEQA